MTARFDTHTAKFLSAVSQNMPRGMSGAMMQRWIDDPKALQNALRSALCLSTEAATCKATPISEMKPWRTIKLGTGLKTGEDFYNALADEDLRADEGGILRRPEFSIATQCLEVDLVRVSVRDLGFERKTLYRAICVRAKKLGLELCPAEVGPQLRLQYLDQPKNEWLLVAMEAVRGADGHQYIFSVAYVDGLRQLSTYLGGLNEVWRPSHQFVFVLPRK